MSDGDLFEALDGLFAYDTGCVDSGIRDERLRTAVKAELTKDDAAGIRRLTEFAKRYMEPPYTLEDVASFIEWLRDHMDYDL